MLEKAERYLSEFKTRYKKNTYEMAKEIKPSHSGWTPYGTYDEQIEIYSLTKSFSINLDSPLYNGNWQVEYYSPNQLVDVIEKETDYFTDQLRQLAKINKKYNGENIPVYYIHSICKELVNLLNYIRNDEDYKLIEKQIRGANDSKQMKIFISHASINKDYGSALVDLLKGIGIDDSKIVFTSNTAYGIPIGENIFDWLKAQINEKSFVVYLLSPEYYRSVACLNEMGAAWVIENDHAAIFLPGFSISSSEFQNGAIDPREIGFHIADKDRVTQFCQKLKTRFAITENFVLLSQSIEKFIAQVNSLSGTLSPLPSIDVSSINATVSSKLGYKDLKEVAENEIHSSVHKASDVRMLMTEELSINGLSEQCSKFFNDILTKKVSDEELLLLHYIAENGQFKLRTGWQTQFEEKAISAWEEIVGLNNLLSSRYEAVIRKFELRKLTEVSAVTSYGNPKEVTLKDEIKNHILDLPSGVSDRLTESIARNPKQESFENNDDDLPF